MIDPKPYTRHVRPQIGDVVILSHDPTRAYLINFQHKLLRFENGRYVLQCIRNYGLGWVLKIGKRRTPGRVYVSRMKRRYSERGRKLTKQPFGICIPPHIQRKAKRATFW